LRRIDGPDGALWRYAAAVRLTVCGNEPGALAEARQRLTEAAQRRPDWSRLILLEAEIDQRAGDPEKALAHYLQAIEQGERQPSVIERTARILYQQDRYAQADEVVRKLEAQGQ